VQTVKNFHLFSLLVNWSRQDWLAGLRISHRAFFGINILDSADVLG
jgi:hypothetical protein